MGRAVSKPLNHLSYPALLAPSSFGSWGITPPSPLLPSISAEVYVSIVSEYYKASAQICAVRRPGPAQQGGSADSVCSSRSLPYPLLHSVISPLLSAIWELTFFVRLIVCSEGIISLLPGIVRELSALAPSGSAAYMARSQSARASESMSFH